jgi:hypothetical protein
MVVPGDGMGHNEGSTSTRILLQVTCPIVALPPLVLKVVEVEPVQINRVLAFRLPAQNAKKASTLLICIAFFAFCAGNLKASTLLMCCGWGVSVRRPNIIETIMVPVHRSCRSGPEFRSKPMWRP